jgi:hypothetical protein
VVNLFLKISYLFIYAIQSRVVSGTEEKNSTSLFLPWMS